MKLLQTDQIDDALRPIARLEKVFALAAAFLVDCLAAEVTVVFVLLVQ